MQITKLIVLGCVFVSAFAFAKEQEDSPLLSRYPGSSMQAYQQVEFGSQEFLTRTSAGFDRLAKEGKVTRIKYIMDDKVSTSALAIVRNAQVSLEKAGFKVKDRFSGELLHQHWQLLQLNKMRVGAAYADLRKDGAEYLLMTRESGSGVQYVAVLTDDASPYHPTYYLILEESQQNFVPLEVSAQEVSKGLKDNGKMELYGIYFDTGKSIIKPESKPTLEKIVQVLKAEPSLKIYVVGHTDSTGDFVSNMQLSQDRAQGVVNALVKDYAVDASRMKAHGVSSLSPLASNTSEFGKAKNRRVELVVQ